MQERHWILLPVDASPQRARRIAEEMAWTAVEQNWSGERPLLVREADSIVSVTSWEPVQAVEPEGG